MELLVFESAQLDPVRRQDLRALWQSAFGERFDDNDADHAYGGVHVLATDEEHIIGHASAIARRIRFGSDPWRTVGYVEAVAVAPERQHSGVGRQVMQRLQTEIVARWPVAMLSTGTATAFYEALGWERWRGLSYTSTSTGVIADDEHGGLMILRPDRPIVPDLSVPVTCEDRPGDAW